MRILAIADDDKLALEGLPDEADLVISLGDIFDSTILKVAETVNASTIFAVKGNHDSDASFADGIIDIHREIYELGNWRFGGFKGCWKYKPRGHHLFEQEEVTDLMKGFPTVDIFVAHNSPRGIHERDTETHQGFDAFNQHIETTKPYLFFHGHQHISENSQLSDTAVIGVYGNAVIDLK